MKRKISLLIMVLVCLALVAGILAACNPTGKKVTFYDNFENGSVYHVSIAEGDAERTMPEDPQKAGYTFAGWYFYNGENSFGRDSYKKFDIGDYDGKEDLSVFARWISAKPEEQQFVVSFYTADGVFLESDIVARGTALEIPNSLYEQEITGSDSKTFVGWKELSTGKAWFFGAGEAVLTDVDLQPILVESLNATLTVEENISVGAAVAAYDFGNAVKTSEEWLRFEIRDAATDAIIADNASDEAVPLAYGVNKFEVQGFYETIDGDKQYVGDEWNITVTRARGEYIAVFNYIEADEGGIKEGTIDENGFIAKPGDDIDLTKEGYNFIGWQLRNGKAAKFWNFATDKVSADIFVEEKNYGEVILYACYEPVPYYVAKFTVGKGETLIGEAEVSVSFDAPAILPTASKKGYTFTGWKSESGELSVGENLAVNGDVAVTTGNWNIECDGAELIFKPIFKLTEYEIIYNLNGGTNNDDNPASYNIESFIKSGEKVDIYLGDPYKLGYTFIAWYDDDNNEVEAISADSTGNKNFTAEWKPTDYSILWIVDGEVYSDTEYTIEIESVDFPAAPEKDGYTFEGWYDENDNEVTGIPAGSTGDKTFWAKWTPKEYAITYDLGGGTNNNNPALYTIKEGVTLEAPSKDYYEFDGWYDEDGKKVTEIPAGSTGNKVFYAKWTPKKYTITYDYNYEGQTSESDSYTIESGATLKNPTRKGYIFCGWYGNEECTEAFKTGVPQNIRVWAKWTPEEYAINYDLGGGYNNAKNLTSYNIESEINLKDPYRPGYTFEGWYENAAFEGDAVTVIPSGSTGDKVFYAKWEVINYSITYYVDGEVYSVDDKYSTYNIETGLDALPAAPEKEGYTFKGWYENAAFEGDAVTVILAGSTGAKTFYAKWEEILVEP